MQSSNNKKSLKGRKKTLKNERESNHFHFNHLEISSPIILQKIRQAQIMSTQIFIMGSHPPNYAKQITTRVKSKQNQEYFRIRKNNLK